MVFTRYILLRGLLLGCFTLLLSFATTAAAATITIAGTGDSQHLLRQLAVAFQEKYPGTQIMVPNSVGSGGGIKLLLADRCQLARVARPLKPKEKAEGLNYRIFAYSPVVFVANLPDSCVGSISKEQFLDIMRGTITDWSQLGSCGEQKIYIANRENGDSSRMILEDNISGFNEIETLAGRIIYSTPEAYETLNRYQYSFGYLPKSQVQKDYLTVLDFNGIAPSTENVQSQRYPLAVPLGIVWRGEPSGETRQFLEFLKTARARDMMQELNAVPATN
jgi:phosphate transport system substrate-binding protein